MTDTEKLLASCYEPPVAAHWDGDVLVLTTTRDPSSIHVQQGDGQQRKVYTGESELFAPPIKDNWQGALCKRIDELCQENERIRKTATMLASARTNLLAENAKLRELVEELWALADGYTPDDSELDMARDLMRELGIEANE